MLSIFSTSSGAFTFLVTLGNAEPSSIIIIFRPPAAVLAVIETSAESGTTTFLNLNIPLTSVNVSP